MILSALNDYYQRLLDDDPKSISPPGYSEEKIGYAIVLAEDGQVVDVLDVRDTSGKKPVPRGLSVPASFKRPGIGAKSFFLWDKTSYVLGVSANSKRSEQEHDAFVTLHREALVNEQDPGLRALLAFLDAWQPRQFKEHPAFVRHGEAMLDANVVFRLGDEPRFLHERPVVRTVWARLSGSVAGSMQGVCLVTGERAPLARLHPAIKGVMDAQNAGASIVSFNLEAFTSYGKQQGENAPISEQVAFAYTTVLNHLLRRDSRQQLRIGDATVVFWAQAGSKAQAEEAESLLASFFDPKDDDIRAIRQLHDVLEQVRQGLPLRDLGGQLDDDTRIFVLGLAPNASRLSICFWETETLAVFAERLARHFDDLRLEPPAWHRPPTPRSLALASAPIYGDKPKSEDVPPQLAGELTRAILSGGRYPRSLLTTIIMRLRADGQIIGTRVALCKAILAREARLGDKDTDKGVPPVSLDPTNTNPGYLLGRLFYIFENAQQHAIGDINAGVKEKFYGAASATPALVFPLLIRNLQNHLSKIKKAGEKEKQIAGAIERDIGGIINAMGSTFPKSLGIEAQGNFAIGYYHQAKARFVSKKDQGPTSTNSEGEAA